MCKQGHDAARIVTLATHSHNHISQSRVSARQAFRRTFHLSMISTVQKQGCTPRPGPGGNGCPGPPRPRKFSTLPRPAPPHPGKRGRCPAPPRPENYPGARIGANVPTSSKVFGSQKLLTSIFSTKGALRRHVTYNNHPNLT